MSGLRVIGRRVPKLDAADKVTGACAYVSDLVVPRMAHGRILRSPVPHGRIVRLDTTAAARVPGVLAICTGRDVVQHPIGHLKDQPPLKGDRVRSCRDEIAAVAAETEAAAAEACARIVVEIAEEPGLFTPEDALATGARVLHAHAPGNRVPLAYAFDGGGVDAAFEAAAHVCDDIFRFPFVSGAALGTTGALAEWDAAGDCTIWSTTQVPYLHQRDLAAALGIGPEHVRVRQPPIGGSFGRGLDLTPLDVIAALLARRAGRPVRIVFDRAEEFLASPTREPCTIRLRTAARADGTLLARDAQVVIDAGAYVSWGATTPYVMMSTVTGLYRVPTARFASTIAYTNNPSSGAMRGYGNLEATFAVEAHMDALAARCGLPTLAIRRRNLNRPGDVTPQGYRITTCALADCLDAAATGAIEPPLPPPPPGRQRGVGYACMFHVGGGARVYRSDGCGAVVRLDDFGRVTLITGASEIGQGADTVLAMCVAETLGVPLARVRVVNGDTAVAPWDVGVHASRTTFVAGNAACEAARRLRTRVCAVAAGLLEASPEALEIVDGVVRVVGAPGRSLPLERVARAAHFRRGGEVLAAEAFYDPPTEMLDGGFRGNVSATYGFAAQAAVVDVDPETGRVEVVRFVSAHDVGRALNPMGCEGQVEGGVQMGLGYALREELQVEAGRVRNAHLMDYRVCTAPDMPEIAVRLIETQPDPAGPFGAKGIGESGAIPVAAAVANAIAAATGVRLRRVPMTPERVHAALGGRRP